MQKPLNSVFGRAATLAHQGWFDRPTVSGSVIAARREMLRSRALLARRSLPSLREAQTVLTTLTQQPAWLPRTEPGGANAG